MNIKYLQKRRVAIFGFGKEGQSLARFFTRHKISFAVFERDRKKFLKSRKGTRFYSGKNYLRKLRDYDVIFRSPGIPWRTPVLQKLIKQGQRVTSVTDLFLRNHKGKVIGITGTKGKGTTALLLHSMLSRKYRSFLGGNIGKSPMEFMDKLNDQSYTILELSSFQLEDLRVSPDIAVVLGISSDHLDYHKTTREYIRAKAPIILYQKAGDIAVLDSQNKATKSFAKKTKAQVYWFSDRSKLFSSKILQIPGLHFAEDASAAALTASILGVSKNEIRRAIATFKGSPHRLQLIKQKRGVSFYDDSAATLPDATIAALAAFPGPKILLVGGASKNASYANLVRAMRKSNLRGVILSGPTGKKIAKLYRRKLPKHFILSNANMDQRVKTAAILAQKGDTVILSPASASFDEFANYAQRGEAFIKTVKKLPI